MLFKTIICSIMLNTVILNLCYISEVVGLGFMNT
jgi:hypothetical protein